MHASVRDLEAESLVCARDGSLSIHVSEAISVQSCERAGAIGASLVVRGDRSESSGKMAVRHGER